MEGQPFLPHDRLKLYQSLFYALQLFLIVLCLSVKQRDLLIHLLVNTDRHLCIGTRRVSDLTCCDTSHCMRGAAHNTSLFTGKFDHASHIHMAIKK